MTASPTMVRAAPALAFDHVATGADFTCGIAQDGMLWCWGANDYGQLGNGTTSTTPSLQPVLVPGGETWSQIAAANRYACGITSGGRLRCWGLNNFGQLGDGTRTSRATPNPVLVGGVDATNWTRIAPTLNDVCALDGDGRVVCWGWSATGQLGLDTGDVVPPTELAGHGPWIAVATGTLHTCAVAEDRRMWCVGDDGYGQLGDGGTSTLAPVRVAGTYTSVSTGLLHTCAIDSGGVAVCAGDNSNEQLGTGDYTPRQTLVAVAPFTKISAGQSQTCAYNETSRTVSCWGGNYRGQLGTNNYTYYATPQMIRAGTTIDTGFLHTCTVDPTSSNIYCWGRASEGQIGNNSAATPSVPAPYQIMSQTWKTVAAGFTHSCGIHTTGNIVRCWGTNTSGQLGIGTMIDNYDPATSTTGLAADQIVAGAYHTCSINDTTHVMSCWGGNYAGQLGLGDNGPRSIPTTVPGMWRQVSAGWEYGCAVRTDGTLWCTGRNDRGQLGIGNRTLQLGMTQVGTDTDWVQVAARNAHTCAIKTDGSLWCWGDNMLGQLATGNAWRSSLLQVP
jgi:alpha-tubulin suppressor-like RCC1 family protein